MGLWLEVHPHRCVFHDTKLQMTVYGYLYTLILGAELIAPCSLIGWRARVTRHLIIDFFAAMTARGNVRSADF